jgi:hypothetical protein
MDSSAGKPEAPNPNWAATTEQSAVKDERCEPWKEGKEEDKKDGETFGKQAGDEGNEQSGGGGGVDGPKTAFT